MRSRKLTGRQQALLAVSAVMAVALLVRVILLYDRAARDPHFFELVEGSDNYVQMAEALLDGDFSLAGTYYQPGNVVWLAAVMAVLGRDMWALYVVNAVVGALSVGAVTGAGWLAFGRRAGLVGGLIAALYPPLIFFHTTLQPVAPATVLAALAVLGGVWAVSRASVWGAALLGAAAGLGALVRPTLLVLAPALVVALVVARDPASPWRGWRRVAALTAAAAVCALLALSPQMIANRTADSSDLISSNGPLALYVGNNRDADGTGVIHVGQAWHVARARYDGWLEAFTKDLSADPGRMAALMLHKVGLFWGNGEVGNNVDYDGQGLDASPLLRVLALDGALGWTVLSWVALVGLLLVPLSGRGRARRAMFTWLAVGAGFYVLGAVAFYVIARLRIVAAPFWFVPAGVAVVEIVDVARGRRRLKQLALAGAAATVLILTFHVFETQLPRKKFYDALPAGATPRYYNFDNEIALVGMEPVESNYQAGEYAYVTLYWQALAPPSRDYSVLVHLVDFEGNKVAGRDEHMLGSITYPPRGTSEWPVGKILAESYLIDLPDEMPDVVNVYAGVYRPETLERLPLVLPDRTATGETAARISAFGIIPAGGFPAIDGASEAVDFALGDSLRITGARIPAQAPSGETLEIALQWEAVGPVPEDYTAFFHLFDAEMNLVVQNDLPVLGPDLPTSAMIPGYPVGATYTLDLPREMAAGSCLLRMGVYTYPGFERLPARDAAGRELPDGLIDLAAIQVQKTTLHSTGD